MGLNLELIKKNLKITHDLEDDLITQYINWASETVINAVFDKYTQDIDMEALQADMTFQRACTLLTVYFYENRLLISEVNMHDAPYSVLNAIQTLRANRKHFIGDSDET